MPPNQDGIVVAYGVLDTIYFIVLLYFTYKLFFETFVHRHLYRQGHEVTATNDTPFRSLSSVSAYVPLVRDASLTKPILFADVNDLPQKFAPVYDGSDDFNDAPRDPTVFSVVNSSEFPSATEKDLKSLFSQVVYYEESANQAQAYDTMNTTAARRVAAITSSAVDEVGKRLPPGWAMKRTASGKPYYVNHINRSTQWKRPEY